MTRAELLRAAISGIRTANRDDELLRPLFELAHEGLVRRCKIPGKPQYLWRLTEKGLREVEG